jgi:hypothetical protein
MQFFLAEEQPALANDFISPFCATKKCSVESALILTYTNEEPFDVGGVPVQVQPVAEWLLQVEV